MDHKSFIEQRDAGQNTRERVLNIFHVTLAWVCLDPGRIRAVNTSDVLEEHIVNVVNGVISKRSDGGATTFVAGHILH